jgi:hypothetical protein
MTDEQKLKQKEYQKQWKINNPEKNKERGRRYYSNNKEKRKKQARDSYLKHIEKRVEKNNQWRNNNRDKIKSYSRINGLKNKFNITLDQYNEIFNKQNGCCMICEKPQSEFPKALCVDHNHQTGKIRGLLCDKCNKGIGFLNDDINILLNAIQYLKDN